MAEPQRMPSSIARPRPAPKQPRPVRHAAPLRPPVDDTQDLSPPEPVQGRRAGRARRSPTARLPSRTPADWALLLVLLLGLGLNAAVLTLNAALTRADVLLGATVLLAGVVLLALMEICRRGGPVSR